MHNVYADTRTALRETADLTASWALDARLAALTATFVGIAAAMRPISDDLAEAARALIDVRADVLAGI